ncbi:ATPase family AAA domain-containing protein 5 [Amia ocellicauda]|uniref:ATPase family AAA domain-containing protein 5 n=1 Tax=Amia ocellicauda TaxID=2972642 RepID=UPI0034641F73
MAGVAAMASVIEDFETPPSKKPRKEGEVPAVKTITNYFLPMSKLADRPFSPPKSNNIMDYFRKTPPAAERSGGPPDPTKENRQRPPEEASGRETPSRSAGNGGKARCLRRGRKPGRRVGLSKQLNDTPSEPGTDPDLAPAGSDLGADGSGEEVRIGDGGGGVLGSDTAALLALVTADACAVEEEACEEERCGTPETDAGGQVGKRSSSVKQLIDAPDRTSQPQATETQEGKGRKGRTDAKTSKAATSGERLHRPAPDSLESQPQLPLSSDGLEGMADEESRLNDSTVTISFEDFLQSQKGEGEISVVEVCAPVGAGVEAVAAGDSGDAEGWAVDEPSPSQHVSPRTLTVQAEVHSAALGSRSAVPQRRVASIFNRRKEEPESGQPTGSPPAPEGTAPAQSQPALPVSAPKRRSNVVVEEEELELAVLESSRPRCSQAERQQFMSAFRQPGGEAGRGQGRRGPGRPREPGQESPALAEEEEPEAETKMVGGESRQAIDAAAATHDATTSTATLLMEDSSKEAGQGGVGGVAKTQRGGGRLRRRGKRKAAVAEQGTAGATPQGGGEGEEKEGEADGSGCISGSGPTPVAPETPASTRLTRGRTRGLPSPATPLNSPPPPQTRSREQRAKAPQVSDSPAQFSTPKARAPNSRVYKSEMICPPDSEESPIRMKFTRVFPRSRRRPVEGRDGEAASQGTQNPAALKSSRTAKSLVKKARALQRSKTRLEEGKGVLRRSARIPDVPRRATYCEDEDSVVCVDDEAQASGMDRRTRMRSLNEVLGKNAAASKAAKTPAGTKVAALFLGKKGPKPSGVISIFDDSSQDGSEASQDDEQVRARREFLRSGLPESFKKQIAKVAACQEAYAASCSSFQAVVHVRQSVAECPLWTLPWPDSVLLKHLKGGCEAPSRMALSVGPLTEVHTKPSVRACVAQGSGWRQDLSEEVRRCLLEEVRASNPPFPVRRFFNWFLKRRSENLSPGGAAAADPGTAPSQPAGGKREREEDRGQGRGGRVSKRRRGAQTTIVIEDDAEAGSALLAQGSGSAEEPSGKGSLSRPRRGRPGRDAPALHTPVQDCQTILLDDSPSPGPPRADGDAGREDVLWTEKFQPQHSSEVLGNSGAVRRLHSWLKEWKQRADREERRNRTDKKPEEDSVDSWDCGDFREDDEDGEEQLCNTVLLTGPPGVGKTAAVYACAQELGFKVFEVNASSQRSGRQILSQLKEATQSHQVDVGGPNAHKPSYFNSHSCVKSSSSPRKTNSPRRVTASPRKPPQSPRGAKRGSLAPTALANFFKLSGRRKGGEKDEPPEKETHPRKPPKVKDRSVSQGRDGVPGSAVGSRDPEEPGKKTSATSLILFEEVDVIFDDDWGFLAAIKTFMATTKRPVVLTTSDPTFSMMFSGSFEEIHFKTPSVVNVASYLQLLCLAENVRTDARDLRSLLHLTGCDIRRSLLQLQLWTRSGGGRAVHRPLITLTATPKGGAVGCAEEAETQMTTTIPPASLPPCDLGCTESMLGLRNIKAAGDLVSLLQGSAEEESCSRGEELVEECRRRRVDLLYSNLEELLPLPVRPLAGPVDTPCVEPKAPETADAKPPAPRPLEGASTPEGAPHSTQRRRGRRKMEMLQFADRDLFQSDSDSDSGFLTLRTTEAECDTTGAASETRESTALAPAATTSIQSEDSNRRVVGSWGPEEARQGPLNQKPSTQTGVKLVPWEGGRLVSRCLGSLADFLDNMSFLDSSLHCEEWPAEGLCWRGGAEGLGWGGAEVKSGLSDEARVERAGAEDGAARDMQAAVESLSFRRCRAAVSEAWQEARQLSGEPGLQTIEELSLPVAPHRQGFSYGQRDPCDPSMLRRRREVLQSVVSSKGLVSVGNRQAAALDYLPALRSICRAEKTKERGRLKRRFLHYLDGVHLSLPKGALETLAADFP